MIPESRSSNRSNFTQGNIRSYQSYESESNEIFNTSFYQQKLDSGETYHSVEYVKRYVNETNLGTIIEKIMGTVLALEKLPYNPYNLMYRLIHHEAIYQNLKRHYNQESEHHNFINSNLQEEAEDFDSNTPEEEDTFIEIKMRDRTVYTTQRLSRYLNMTNLYVFHKIVNSKRVLQRLKAAEEKFNIDEIHLSLGGPLILNLRGNNGSLDVPVKLPRQAADKSIYSAESMLTTTTYIQTNRELSKSFQSFVEFVLILQDIRESMQFKDEYHTVYFQKLEVTNIDDIFSLMEFSRQQIINSSGLVQKQLIRILEKENVTIRSRNVYRLSKEILPVIGEELVTVIREYALIAEEDGLTSMVSNEPLRYLFKEVFCGEHIIDLVSQNPDYRGKDLLAEYKKEMIYHLLYELKMQNTSYLVWQIFYYLVYQNRSSRDNIEFVNQIHHTISYLLLSPIGFVYQLQHSLRTVKWLTLPSFPTQSEHETYSIIISLERDITAFIQRGNYIYWELQIFYEAIKVLLSIIVEIKQLKISAINFLVDHALLLLSGVTTNFNHILIVLQGNITNYINVMCQMLVQGKEESQKVITYDLYLKEKQLPTSVLRLNEEAKKIKKQLSMQESEVKTIILGKYVAKHRLYEKIYAFYWELIIGKKVMYPLSRFLKLLMINSTQCNYDIFKDNYTPPKFKIESNVVNSIPIYEINHTDSSTAFYSLHPESLQVQALKEYKIIMDLIEPFLEMGPTSEGSLGYRYGSKISVESLNNSSSSQKSSKRIISIKSIDMGDHISEESSSFSVCKVLIDLALGLSFSSKNELYSFVLDQINSLMERLDGQNFSVLGLFPYHQNHYDAQAFEDHLYSKLFSEENCLRFDYKKKIQLDKFSKFMDYNINQGRFVEIKVIYVVREVTKVLKISVNFHYKLRQNFVSLFRTHYVDERVFPTKKDILNWCELYPQIKNKTNQTSSSQALTSLKKLEEDKEVSITEVLSERELGDKEKRQGEASKFKYYRQSPFYNLLRKVGETIQVFLTVLQYLKSDRRGRFDLSSLEQLYQLLKYYLLDRCIIKDDYIYSEGVSVSMVNLIMLLKEYFEKHPDNVGEEKQLLQFQKILRKLWCLVKYAEISCTICIHQSLNVISGREGP